MPTNSKNKGNTFERKIANAFSERFKEKTGIAASFRRNPDSGSFFGSTNDRRMKTHDVSKANFGDIICPDDFKFTIECKHYKTPPTFSMFLKGECTLLDTWIKEAEHDAKNCGKLPCVVMKFNNVLESVVVHQDFGFPGAVVRYKGHDIIPLAVFLLNSDDHFFE